MYNDYNFCIINKPSKCNQSLKCEEIDYHYDY